MTSQLRDLPSVQRVLSEDGVRRLVESYSHDAVVELVRAELDTARRAIRNGGAAPEADADRGRGGGPRFGALAGLAHPRRQRHGRGAAHQPWARPR